MKPSILIPMLQQILVENGDVETWAISDTGSAFLVEAIALLDGPDGKIVAVFISGDQARNVIDKKIGELTFKVIEKARKKDV